MDILRHRMWHELSSAKYNSVFLSELIRKHRSRVRMFDIFIAVTAGAGALLSKAVEIAPLIATIAVSLAALIKALRPSVLMAENQLAVADVQHQFYEQYLHRLERLWMEFEAGFVKEDEALIKFFELKTSEDEHIIPTNQLSAFFTLNTESIHNKSDEYVKTIFYPSPEASSTEPG